jgi:hypothetical protein
VVARLLAAGCDPNAPVPLPMRSGEVHQSTALHAAAAHGRLEAARLLLDGGADPSRADSRGVTPLMTAAPRGELEVVRLLLAWGAAVDAVHPGNGATAFHAACDHNQVECAEVLARTGCDVGLKTTAGETGQQRAEAQGSKDVLRRLRALARQPFVGVLVELAGLVGAAEHNGKRATVMSTRPSRGHHASVFLARAHRVRTLHKHRRTLCVAVEWRSSLPFPHCGARCCATCRRSSATRWSCWSRRPGVAARGSAWTCGRRTLCWRTCRPARGAPGPGGSIGSRRCSPVSIKSALTGLDSRVSNGPY